MLSIIAFVDEIGVPTKSTGVKSRSRDVTRRDGSE